MRLKHSARPKRATVALTVETLQRALDAATVERDEPVIRLVSAQRYERELEFIRAKESVR